MTEKDTKTLEFKPMVTESCKRGHKWKASEPWAMIINQEPKRTSKPLCAYCLMDRLEELCPAIVNTESAEKAGGGE